MSSASCPTVLPVLSVDGCAPVAPPAGEARAGLGCLVDCSQWQSGTDGQRVALSQLVLSGLYCAACAGIIETALKRQPGVLDAQVNAASQRLSLQWSPALTDAPALLRAIAKAGYGAAPDVAAPALALRKVEHRKAVWRLFVAWFLMMQVMMLAAPAYFAEAGDMAPDLKLLMQWGSWVLTLPVMLFAAGPFFQSAWRQLRQRSLGMDVPVSLGLAVSFAASTGASFDPGGVFGHEVYFDSLTMFVAFLLTGRYLELRARHRVAASLEAALTQLPELAERINADGTLSQVRVGELVVGDRVRVFAGQGFPADGQVLEGGTEADEALLTGESRPVPKRKGDSVVAGSVNLQAPVTVWVQRVGADTRFEGIKALMRSAMTRRPQQLRLADRVGAFFLWGVLVLAAGGALVWSFIDPSRVVWVAVSVLIVTCPCALALATPSAWLAATGALARRGLLLQRMELLDSLPGVTHVVFDKTGTLTEDELELCDADALDPALLLQAAALARQSRHPMSRALARACTPGGDEPLWHDIVEVAGCGLQARDAQGQVWRLGAQAWVMGEGSAVDGEVAQLVFGPQRPPVAGAGAPALMLRFRETLRADALRAVQALQDQGLGLSLLSGDASARVAEVAARAGIANAVGAATPELKLAHVSALQAAGHRVLMVGDGINDAPVLAQADASIAMGQGAVVAKAQADGFLLSERLMDIVAARALALRTRRVVRQNLAWALAYNLSCIPLALMGWLPPWAAGLGMAASSLLVVSNSLRLGRGLDKKE
ncbi:Cu2+-exporting ATPase [Roseateles toxinivorans]|uniref:Cu2+-exporting ATPase n=1 Tax=Roseateles toxinivorans TaxID=270368 RepID=A0A4R6QTL1_9BURK|nr:Cu2+-exporting ATPase [Roseateles toxinivorans]